MRIDLIFPGITFWGFNSFGKLKTQEANFMPHGLASISAYLKSQGHEVGMIDMRKLKNWKHFEQIILQSTANVFGISSMSVDYEASVMAASLIKQLKPSSTVIIGGVHPTVATDAVLQNPSFDHVITGEGEYCLSHLLEQLDQNKKPERLLTGESVDITALPWVDREMFDYENGEGKNPLLSYMETPFVSIVTSRGCPYRCRFCQPAERMIFGNKVKIRPVDDVIKELVYLREKYRFKSFLIHDDLFILKPKYVEDFAREYTAHGFTQKFVCQARADIVVNLEDRIKMLTDAGLDCLMIGFESGSQRMLDFMEKGITLEQSIKAVEICRKYNIKIYANFMFGLPTETREDMEATVDFIRWMKPDFLSLAVFTPYPGSYLYDYCNEKGLLLKLSHKSYRRTPFSGSKIKNVNYWLVYYEIFKCDPLSFRYVFLTKFIGNKGAILLSKIKHHMSDLVANH
jgi:radical SAM superfamily enzyme YgiQ (UPF0313 family)